MARGETRDNGKGVLVDTLHFESMGVTLTDKAREALGESDDEQPDTAVGKVKIPVEVRLRKAYADGGGTNRAVTEVQFSLVCSNPDITLRGTDIETLRKAMWGELDKAHAIRWEPHLLITIEPAMSYGSGISEGLRLEEVTVWKGTTQDGYEMLREYARESRLSMGSSYTYRPWPGAFQDRRGRVTACIPETEANREAMDQFRTRIVELRKMLQDLVRPDRIMATLANLSGIALIAAPEATPAIEEQA